MAEQQGPPKIIVDSDWKQQAQAERERLAAKEREAAAKTPPSRAGQPGTAPGGGGGGAAGPQSLPPADFQSLVGTLATQALMYLGAFPDPETGRAVVSLEYAKFHIDMLEVLETKCKGNLTPEESSDISQALNELRMRFVEITKAVAQMAKRGEIGPGGMVGGPPGGSGGGAAGLAGGPRF